jgi:hypothetical protein
VAIGNTVDTHTEGTDILRKVEINHTQGAGLPHVGGKGIVEVVVIVPDVLMQ